MQMQNSEPLLIYTKLIIKEAGGPPAFGAFIRYFIEVGKEEDTMKPKQND